MALPLILAAGAGGMQGFASYTQAKSAQEYQGAVASAQRKAVGVEQQQLSDQAALERLKSHNEANLIRSKLRVAAGESGIGFGGTYEALVRQADYDEGINEEIINRNWMNAVKASSSRLQPGQPQMNPLLASFLGFMGGAESGLKIGGAVSKFGGNTGRTA